MRWLSEKQHKKDLRNDKQKLRWLDRHFGDLYIDEINRDLINDVGRLKRSEASSPTANRYLALIRSILRACRDEWEWLVHIPQVKLFKEPKKRVRWITPEEARRLIGELPEHLADMAAFTLATGLRQSNVSYLKWRQIDMERRVAWIYADEFKSEKAISVPLNQDAMNILDRRRDRHDVYVFTYRGKPQDRTSTKAWYKALKRAGIQEFKWHDLRHTWASWHVQNGTSLQELMELGGWSSYEIVLRYAHLASDHLIDAASRIQGSLSLTDRTDDKS